MQQVSNRAETQQPGRRDLESGAGGHWGLVLGGLLGCWPVGWLLGADTMCMAVGDVPGEGHSLAPTAAVLPTCPARPGGTARTLPICPASLPLTKMTESRLQGTGAWHPSAGNARPSPPWSRPALAPLPLGSQEHVVGVGLLPWLEGAGFSLGHVRQPGVEVGALPPRPGQATSILLTSSLRISSA